MRRAAPLVARGALAALLALAAFAPGEDAPALRTAPVAALPGSHLAPREPVPILMYHRVERVKPGTPRRLLRVTREDFARQVRALKRAGYHAVTQRRVWRAWHAGGTLPSNPIVLSFDDGYRGQVTNALPILRSTGWPAVLNLTLRNLPGMGGTRAVKRMIRAGWELASHTRTHPDLRTLSPGELHDEVAGARHRLRRLFDVAVSFFCYPNGRYDDVVVAAVREAGHVAATTVVPGWAHPDEPYTLRRVRVDGGMSAKALLERLRALRD